MVNIVIFVAIAALACVNAQLNFPYPGVQQMGGPFDMLFKHMGNPEEFIKQQNLKVMTPEEVLNMQPQQNQNFKAQMVKSESTGDGKMRTSVLYNDNGQKKGYTFTN